MDVRIFYDFDTREYVVSNDGEEYGLRNVHPVKACEGRPCVLHAPTEHHMRDWHLHWRDDRGIFERICAHGVGHPDPDQFDFWFLSGRIAESIHGCDGCCGEKGGYVGTGNFEVRK